MAVGLDIGGSKIEGVLLDDSGAVASRARREIVRGEEGVLATAMNVLADLERDSRRGIATFDTVGVGVPGQVDASTGTVRHAHNLGVDEMALGPQLSERAGLPVSVENDVTAAAIGANHLMGLTGTIAYLNLGTGLAAGIVVDGKPIRGVNGYAGELGHLAIDPLQRPCLCGQLGCLETVASASALARFWPEGGDQPSRALLAAVERGEPAASAALDNLVTGTATAVRVLGLTLDPATIVIGGGIRMLGDPLLDGVRHHLDAWGESSPFFAALRLSSRIQVLPEGSQAAAVGAALAPAV